jgi:hypothetical protein
MIGVTGGFITNCTVVYAHLSKSMRSLAFVKPWRPRILLISLYLLFVFGKVTKR